MPPSELHRSPRSVMDLLVQDHGPERASSRGLLLRVGTNFDRIYFWILWIARPAIKGSRSRWTPRLRWGSRISVAVDPSTEVISVAVQISPYVGRARQGAADVRVDASTERFTSVVYRPPRLWALCPGRIAVAEDVGPVDVWMRILESGDVILAAPASLAARVRQCHQSRWHDTEYRVFRVSADRVDPLGFTAKPRARAPR